jgi:hypothetical protein
VTLRSCPWSLVDLGCSAISSIALSSTTGTKASFSLDGVITVGIGIGGLVGCIEGFGVGIESSIK